jgi:hypothetical protein
MKRLVLRIRRLGGTHDALLRPCQSFVLIYLTNEVVAPNDHIIVIVQSSLRIKVYTIGNLPVLLIQLTNIDCNEKTCVTHSATGRGGLRVCLFPHYMILHPSLFLRTAVLPTDDTLDESAISRCTIFLITQI